MTGYLTTPKRIALAAIGKAAWYGYYAGFSPQFVQNVLGILAVDARAVIGDPWNGAGTTTQVAHDYGVSAFGYDLNPAMVVVSKARLLGTETESSHKVLCRHILKTTSAYASTPTPNEPLLDWFGPQPAAYLRNIEKAIQKLLVFDGPYSSLAQSTDLSTVSSLAAFYYVALFRTGRDLLSRFRTTNPTWLKRPRSPARLARPSVETVRARFKKHVDDMTKGLNESPYPVSAKPRSIKVGVADSRSLPLADSALDAIISSPPYCTRIDYTMATRSELAILGYSRQELASLRDRMIGTSKIGRRSVSPNPSWGDSCNTFLERVRTHKSHASESYYWKNHLQYFEGVYASMQELRRVLRPEMPCVLVVQDSFYKELHNDLPTYLIEMANVAGLTLKTRYDYSVYHTLAGLHPHRKKYRSHAAATETVLWFANSPKTNVTNSRSGLPGLIKH